ncbi:MAG: class I SAM-dependent methyltransferase [Actinomycetota bacterium]|nr:class I SAM-dependent methyltransferase [Actinomycetota bacterium]
MTAFAGALEPRLCPSCRSARSSILLSEARLDDGALGAFAYSSRKVPELMHHRLLQCLDCDLVYASPAPNPEELAKAYREASFDSSEEARSASFTYDRLVRRLATGLPPVGGALDIGTGDGAFLERLMAAGFDDVVGIEPSAAPIDAAGPAARERIQEGFFDPGRFEAGRFRLVTAFQTLEHVADPGGLCVGAKQVLCRGGALLVVCHDRRALINRLMGRRSPIFDVEHLQLFSKASLRSLLQRSGLNGVRCMTFSNRYPLRYWVRLAPLPPAPKAALLGALRRMHLADIPVTLPAGNIAAIGYAE